MNNQLLSKAKPNTKNEGFCLYRLPQSNVFHLVKGKDQELSSNAFVFYPFDLSYPPIHLSIKENLNFQNIESAIENIAFNNIQLNSSNQTNTEFFAYQNGFETIKNSIENGDIQKAILSKITVVQLDKSFDLKQWVKQIFEKHPSAFCYVFYHPKAGLWVGASPETLLSKKQSYFQTVALAGTKNSKQIPWGEKEIIEHSLVAQSIENELQNLKITYQKFPLKTVKAGKVYHLKQVFNLKLKQEDCKNLIQKLHPTPAIGGFPKEKALKIISKAETHSRAYYCGYLGVQSIKKTQVFVNLRCAQVNQNQIEFYSGGGITSGSILQKEWEECNRKAQNLIGLL